MKIRSIIAVFALLFTTTGCGYRWGQGSTLVNYRTIAVPYVEGDWDGDLTAELIRQLSQTGVVQYSPSGSAVLRVRILNTDEDHIGFQYDINKEGEKKDIIIPNETRLTTVVEVQLIEAISNRIILGPVKLSADLVFDHDYYSTRKGVNVFSLGQLTDIEEAETAAIHPLNLRLAEKIVDYVIDSW